MNRQLRRREARQKQKRGVAASGEFDTLARSIEQLLRTDGQQQALEQCRMALGDAPDNPDLHRMHGIVLQAMEQYEEAIEAYDKAIALVPRNLPALVNKAVCARECSAPDAALEALDTALRIDPNSIHAHYNKALVLCDLRRPEEAVSALRKTIRLKPDLADAHYQLAFLLEMLEDYEAAIASYKTALRYAPMNASYETSLGSCLQVIGRFDDAAEHLRKAISLKPQDGRSHYMLAYSDQADTSDAGRATIARALANPGTSDEDRINLHFAAARLSERVGDLDTAFDNYVQGNRIRDAELPFDTQAYKSLPGRIAAIFTPEFLEAWSASGSMDKRPIFIVGMPRSGTTLVEQIIAAHPAAYGAGELACLAKIGAVPHLGAADEGGFPETMSSLTGQQLAQFAADYLAFYPPASRDAARVVDKTPGNALAVGLLAIMFPHARFIHCDRDPMDSCWSIFCHNFLSDLPYVSNFDRLAVFYNAQKQIMDHWSEVLGDRILDVKYETLVDQPEAGIRAIIDHCGLDWNERCLAFHTVERGVHTASVAQVRKPMFSNSVSKWRKFEPWLAPLSHALNAT